MNNAMSIMYVVMQKLNGKCVLCDIVVGTGSFLEVFTVANLYILRGLIFLHDKPFCGNIRQTIPW